MMKIAKKRHTLLIQMQRYAQEFTSHLSVQDEENK